MGTRGLTMVIEGGQTKVAQYGQWDHYPSGQGLTILEFLRTLDVPYFKGQLKKCAFTDGIEVEEFLKSIGAEGGWMIDSQSKLYHTKYPYFSRDHGAEVLNLINNSKDDVILLEDSTEFGTVGGALFCEWSYVIDFDKNVLEVNRGTVDRENPTKSFDIKNLPTKEEFVKFFEKTDEDW